MNLPNIGKWTERIVRDALVHAQVGGSFENFIKEMMENKLFLMINEINQASQLKIQSEIERQKTDIYERAYAEGQKSVSDTSAYDNGYKKGYKDASDIAESNRRWDSFKPGDMK